MEDISKILKNAPQGIQLYSLMYGYVRLREVLSDGSILCTNSLTEVPTANTTVYTKEGKYKDSGACILFPHENATTWECWQEYLVYQIMSIGSVIVSVFTTEKLSDTRLDYYISTETGFFNLETQKEEKDFSKEVLTNLRFADEEETAFVFTKLKGLGYFFNERLGRVEECEKAWEISDAKAGDILVNQFGLPFIFKSYEGDKVASYCGVYTYSLELQLDATPSDYWTESSKVCPAIEEDKELMYDIMGKNGYEWDEIKKELYPIHSESDKKTEHKFKEGDWLLNYVEGQYPCLVTKVTSEGYDCINQNGDSFKLSKSYECKYRLWTIQAVERGDILIDSKKQRVMVNFLQEDNNSVNVLCYLLPGEPMQFPVGGLSSFSVIDSKLATPEECKEFHESLRASGYYYDKLNGVLDSIEISEQAETPDKLSYDKVEFQPFDKVLVRDTESDEWTIDFFERMVQFDEESYLPYKCMCSFWRYCIPYNDTTKSLIGTTNDCPECYK